MISLNYKDPRPIYEQIKQGFIKLIVSGAMAEDDKLPSVRELASQLAINPNTIQKAYMLLEAEDYIYSISGKGSFVSSNHDAGRRRKNQLMDDLKKIVLEIKDMSVEKQELIEMIEALYETKPGKGGAEND